MTMLKAIGWVFANLPLLVTVVTVTVSLVEAVGAYLKEGGPEKKVRAVRIVRENIDKFLVAPEWLTPHLDALLSMLIDGVVFVLNLTRGRQWGETLGLAGTVEAVTGPVTVPPRPVVSDNDKRLDELQARLEKPL